MEFIVMSCVYMVDLSMVRKAVVKIIDFQLFFDILVPENETPEIFKTKSKRYYS